MSSTDEDLLEALEPTSTTTDEDIMRMIKNGADVNALNDVNQNALQLIAVNNRIGLFLTIIANTDDINHRDVWGHTALMLAVINDNIDVVKALMMDTRVKINIQTHDELENTALHFAVLRKNYEMVEQLMGKTEHNIVEEFADGKIDTEIRNADKETAWDIAWRNRDYEIASLIGRRYFTRQSAKAAQPGHDDFNLRF